MQAADEKLAKARKKMYSLHRNCKKKLIRRDHQAENNKIVIEQLQKKVNQADTQLKNLKLNLDKVRHRYSYWKSKYDQVVSCEDIECTNCKTAEDRYIELNEEIKGLEEELSWMMCQTEGK